MQTLAKMRRLLGKSPILRDALKRLRSMVVTISQSMRPRSDPWRLYPYVNTRKYRAQLRSKKSYRPLGLQCETVNTCNNLCVICAYPEAKREKITMPMVVFEKILSDYSEMGGGYLSLTPVTGDILFDKYLFERFECIKRFPRIREVGVTTNAVLLDRYSDSQVKLMVDSLNKIQISFYGIDEEEYLAMTRRNTYHRAIAGVRSILKVRRENVYFSFRLLKQRSRNEIERWVEQTFGQIGSGAINSVMTGGYANFASLNTAEKLPFGATWAVSPTTKAQCLIPLLAIQVSSNGEVAFCPCVGALDGLVLGDIRDNTLLELYNSPKVRALWNWAKFGVPDSCAKCSFYQPLETIIDDASIISNPFKLAGA